MLRFLSSRTFIMFVTLFGLLFSLTIRSEAQVPKNLNYQGYLTDTDGEPIRGDVQMTFGLYETAMGGTPVWQETQTVQCQEGYYNVIFGKSGNLVILPGPRQYYLGVQVGTEPEMTPRHVVTSVMSALFVDGVRFLGDDTTILNKEAGLNNPTGTGNTYVGKGAGVSNTTGNQNVFIGAWAGDHNTTGPCNTFVGFGAGNQNTTGSCNTYLGSGAGSENILGSGNTAIGIAAGGKNTGNDNTFLGTSAGDANVTGSANVFIGFQAGRNEAGSNRLYIANSETATPLVYGEFDTSKLVVNGELGISHQNPQAKLTISGIPFDDAGGQTTRPNFREASIYIGNTNSFFDYEGGLTFRGTGGNWATRFTGTSSMTPTGEIVGIYTEETAPGSVGATIASFKNDRTVELGGYLKLATTAGMPPTADCDDPAEYARMKVDPTNGTLWICAAAGWIAK